jgi:hypothetical protein
MKKPGANLPGLLFLDSYFHYTGWSETPMPSISWMEVIE